MLYQDMHGLNFSDLNSVAFFAEMGGISKWYTKTCMVVGLCLIFMFEPVTSENTKPAFIRFLRRYQSGNSRVSGSEAQVNTNKNFS